MFARHVSRIGRYGTGSVRSLRKRVAMGLNIGERSHVSPVSVSTRSFAEDKGLTDFRFNLADEDDDEVLGLDEAVARELEDESSNVEEIDSELESIQAQIEESFSINAGADGNSAVTLTRSYGDEDITLVFHAQDENREEVMDDLMGDEFGGDSATHVTSYDDDNGDEDFDEADDSYGIDFRVTVTRGARAMVFHCCAALNVIVKRVSMHAVADVVPGAVDHSENSALYRGPDFERLDDGLQASFKAYLEERGIDDDMTFFILSYSQQKEQADYVDWLKRVQTFVDK